jgi:hypothetical protein
MAVQLTGLWANYGFRMVYMWSSCTRSRGLQPDLSMSVLLRQNRDLYSWSLPCFSLIFSTHLSVSLFLLRMLYRRWRQQRRNKLMTKVWMLAIETGVAKEMALYDKIKKVQSSWEEKDKLKKCYGMWMQMTLIQLTKPSILCWAVKTWEKQMEKKLLSKSEKNTVK